MPELELPQDASQSALEAVLRSRSFAGAQRRRRLLEYLVEQTASGHGSSLKEFNIGVAVYGRDPATYDPRIDPVVRVDIGRLRTKLKEYYETDGRNDPVRIELPKGSYAVAFREISLAAPTSAPETLPLEGTRERLEQRVQTDTFLASRSPRAREIYVTATLAAIAGTVILLAVNWLSHRVGTTPVKHGPDPEAYSLLLKARARSAEGTREAFNQAVIYLNQSIRRDPTYADAYAALAGAYAAAAVNFAAQPLEYGEKAKAAAETALRFDPASAQAYGAEGMVDSTVFLDWRRGERELQKAAQLDPKNAHIHSWFRIVLLAQGRFEEADLEARSTATLAPLSAAGGVGVGLVHYMARDYDRALAEFLKARELHPEVIATRLFVGMAWEAKGEFAKAMAEYQVCLPQMPEVKTNVAHLLAVMGRHEEARKMLAEIEGEASGRVYNPFDIACVYAALGDRDRAFKWLDRAYEDRAIVDLKVHPMLDPLRGDPRFARLLKKAGLAG